MTNTCQKFQTLTNFTSLIQKAILVLAEEQEDGSTNWLEANCGDLHEERKFIVFESKLKELFSSSVCCPNCDRKVKNMTLTTKGSVATIESLSWMLSEANVLSNSTVCELNGRGKFTAQCRNLVHRK